MPRIVVYLIFVSLTVGIGLLIGIANIPDEWYQALVKPWFTPPNWLFGPAWTILYILIGIVGARTFEQHRSSLSMSIWALQMFLNFCWSPAFFALKSPVLALAIILPLLMLIVAFIGLSWKKDRISAALFVPYAIWVAYASALNAAIVGLN